MAKLYTRKSDGTYVPYNPQSVTNIDVVQTTGNSVTATMSQDAVTKKLTAKQDTLTPGNGISIKGNVVGVTAITESESQPDTSLWLNPSEDEETDVTYNRSQIDAMVGAKQDALQLTVKDNGNIVLANIQGQSKEFMPATPSGDPMHYAYVAAGAEYNDTGIDIVKATPWADLADNDADKTVIHKAGYWYLNGLGDLTNNDMLNVLWTNKPFSFALFAGTSHKFRTNICFEDNNPFIFNVRGNCDDLIRKNIKIEVLRLPISDGYYYSPGSANGLCNASNVIHIINIFNVRNISSFNNSFFKSKLRTIKIKNLKCNVSFNNSVITIKSVLYMIQNEAATSPITITLHADVYARAMANADILAALEAHPNVSLASA